MVHALREVHRVLVTGGMVADLRPAPEHRRVSITRGGRTGLIGTMRESFREDHAADRAVDRVVREGWFAVERRLRFDCRRVMDTVAELREWLGDFDTRRGHASHEWLARRVERALGRGSAPSRIIARGPLILNALRKLEPAPRSRARGASRRGGRRVGR
jgi:hypothetical protein